MHDLVHRTCIDAAAADDPDEVLHRLARYATVNERLIAARMALQGRTPWWARAGYPAMLAVYVGIVSAWKPGMTSLVIGSLSGVIVAQLVRTPNECKVVGMPSVGHADISAGVVAGIDQSSTALADLAQTPAVVAARAELTAAREILASAYNSST